MRHLLVLIPLACAAALVFGVATFSQPAEAGVCNRPEVQTC